MRILMACAQPMMNESLAYYIRSLRPEWRVGRDVDDVSGEDCDIVLTDSECPEIILTHCIDVTGKSLRSVLYEMQKISATLEKGTQELLRSHRLTAREHQVLGCLSQGQSNKEIARALGLQVATVKLHVRNVCRKLGAKNRTQAVLIAQRFSLH